MTREEMSKQHHLACDLMPQLGLCRWPIGKVQIESQQSQGSRLPFRVVASETTMLLDFIDGFGERLVDFSDGGLDFTDGWMPGFIEVLKLIHRTLSMHTNTRIS